MVSEEHADERPNQAAGRDRVLDPTQDTAALKALTHPLRIRLLGLLRQHGPGTASELAARTGESSASTSYHLRVLAKYAFVEEAEHKDGRERRWRSAHAVTSWNNEAMWATPEGRAFVDFTRRQQMNHLQATLVQHEADMADGLLGPDWTEAAGFSDLMPRLTPESVSELQRFFREKLTELSARDEGDARAEQVVVFTAALPLAQHNSPPQTTTSDISDGAS
ncbi:transcriptional regulator [Streptomyces spiroverticillatus]|uniref:Transcriptional regulator n=1 Tax=Streptomyces finlayi TaxID=67296 RepID=A0A918WZ25_9ACTN|nr:winged helix-turn-helix domain-containing protein [Streptomyces finlayi]GHA15781.1 transcriptional regulator [Streptomyces spiroverticillatus]GHC96507.1 transcriptional regulator [Streptomyces finlayi]